MPEPKAVPAPRVVDSNGVELVPFTCPWAQAGLANALDGMNATSSGVKGYRIGSRSVDYMTPGDQVNSVAYWNEMVKLYCGTDGLPSAVTGRDTAMRVVLRDI
jgi:hypothetical protein